MILTPSQKHWRAWLSALQTRDAGLRAAALEQLSKFLDYWTAELYVPAQFRGVNGRDTPQAESWDEVFTVDAELPIRDIPKPALTRGHTDEAWVHIVSAGVTNSSLDHMAWMSIRFSHTQLGDH